MSSSRTRWGIEGGYTTRETGPAGWGANAPLTLQPIDRLRLGLQTSYERLSNNRQYVHTEAGGNQETYGSRYIVSAARAPSSTGRGRLAA